jgi:hypothetical protein
MPAPFSNGIETPNHLIDTPASSNRSAFLPKAQLQDDTSLQSPMPMPSDSLLFGNVGGVVDVMVTVSLVSHLISTLLLRTTNVTVPALEVL